MREIKFRAWGGGQMLSMPICTIFGLSRFFGFLSDDAIIMQFTGLKDKNGKEIYEGDVVKFVNGNIGYIVYDLLLTIVDDEQFKCLCFCCMLVRNGKGSVTIENTDEIIGNIYENPELLK